MNHYLSSLITALLLSMATLTASAEQTSTLTTGFEEESKLQGYGAFTSLNKDWMLMALYVDPVDDVKGTAAPQRLEIKISTEKFSQRRFRSLWLNALAIEHGAEKMAAMQGELNQFFDLIQQPLMSGDILIIERTQFGDNTSNEIKINYHTLANLSSEFLPFMVKSLVGQHPPTQALKSGLMGEESLRAQTNLSIRFDRLEPTLPRIAEVSRWRKRILASN